MLAVTNAFAFTKKRGLFSSWFRRQKVRLGTPFASASPEGLTEEADAIMTGQEAQEEGGPSPSFTATLLLEVTRVP